MSDGCSSRVEDILKASVVRLVYQETVRSSKLVLCIADDTIASHTKPSSQAAYPIEAAYFHQSYLKGCQDYGYQAVSVMLSCNGITINYDFFETGSESPIESGLKIPRSYLFQ